MKTYTHLIGLITVGLLARLAAAEQLFEIEIPNAFPPELQKLPSITLKAPDGNGLNDRKTTMSEEIELAISKNDLPKLSKILASIDVEAQRQAATAIGKLTSQKPQARQLLATFIATNSNSLRTEFGEQLFARQNATIAAKKSLTELDTSSVWWLSALGAIVLLTVWMIRRIIKCCQRQFTAS